MPAGGNQIARAFAWRVADFIAENGEIGLFLPAMTLFDTQASDFRRKFLAKMRVRTVVNFANLAEVISAGRFRVPAAAFFYAPRREDVCEPDEAEVIRVYSPLVANQEPTRPTASRGKRNECWSIVINASDIRDIEASEVLGGSGLPWKLATWGSRLDLRLLRSVSKRFRSLGEMEKRGDLVVHEGPQLRTVEVRSGPEKTEEHPELVGRRVLATKPLERIRGIFTFPPTAYETNTQQFLRLRGGCAGLAVCRPPHVIVSAARNFAVYSDEFLIVPPRQIGISSPSGDTDMLKALSLYLSSDFAFYHQFLTATESGVKRDRATLGALRTLPVPLGEMNRNDLKRWANLHARLVEATKDAFREQERAEAPLCGGLPPGQVVPSELIGELNSLVYDSLRMDALEQALVKDLVHVRLELKDGKVGEAAVRKPTEEELRAYAVCLKGELDDFAGGDSAKRHQVQIVHDDLSGMVGIDFTKDRAAARKVVVAKAGRPAAEELERVRRRLRRERSQWVYFDRNLRIYEGPRTYVLKPMQRFHWTVSQAMLDAAEVIAETLGGEDAD